MTTDSEGAGRWRGQPGSLNVKKVLQPTTAMAWMVSSAHTLSGICGGDDASSYSSHFEVGTPNEYKIELIANALLPQGAVIAYQHGGGAGFEPALLRDPAAVRDDVLDEIISVSRAADKYGVIFSGTAEAYDLDVDVAATTALRKTMRTAAAA
jgi:N-methylhydantoinase B